jgi:hypothetical protein
VRAVEENCEPATHLPELMAHENAISKSLDGRSVFDNRIRMKKPPVAAKRQLSLF